MKKTHDFVHRYRGYRSDGDRCRIRIYREDGRGGSREPTVICSSFPSLRWWSATV
jgi:hypothetical protein